MLWGILRLVSGLTQEIIWNYTLKLRISQHIYNVNHWVSIPGTANPIKTFEYSIIVNPNTYSNTWQFSWIDSSSLYTSGDLCITTVHIFKHMLLWTMDFTCLFLEPPGTTTYIELHWDHTHTIHLKSVYHFGGLPLIFLDIKYSYTTYKIWNPIDYNNKSMNSVLCLCVWQPVLF